MLTCHKPSNSRAILVLDNGLDLSPTEMRDGSFKRASWNRKLRCRSPFLSAAVWHSYTLPFDLDKVDEVYITGLLHLTHLGAMTLCSLFPEQSSLSPVP